MDKLLNHIPELKLQHEGKFQWILVTQDKVVFFFAFEKSEMKPASNARRSEFSIVLKLEAEVFPTQLTSILSTSLFMSLLSSVWLSQKQHQL